MKQQRDIVTLEQNGFVEKLVRDGYDEGEKGINYKRWLFRKWDQVRGHTNMAKGTIGRIIAEELISKGAYVIYLHGYLRRNRNRMI